MLGAHDHLLPEGPCKCTPSEAKFLHDIVLVIEVNTLALHRSSISHVGFRPRMEAEIELSRGGW